MLFDLHVTVLKTVLAVRFAVDLSLPMQLFEQLCRRDTGKKKKGKGKGKKKK